MPSADSKLISALVSGINIEFPSVAGIDKKLSAEILSLTQQTLEQAVRAGWIDDENASTEYIKLANKFGIDVDVAEKEEEEKDENGMPKKTDKEKQDDDEYHRVLNRMDQKQNPNKKAM